MEIDSNYIQYLVSQEVAKQVPAAVKPLQDGMVKMIDRYHDLSLKMKEIAPEFIQRKWELEKKGVPTGEALAELWKDFDDAAAELAEKK